LGIALNFAVFLFFSVVIFPYIYFVFFVVAGKKEIKKRIKEK
jgi:hypothetical protein